MKFFLLVLFFVSNLFLAQSPDFEPVDYNKIKKNIEDKNSDFYYPKLLEQLQKNDTLFTPQQYRHLYYGFTFQKNYKPYNVSDEDQKLTDYYKKTELNASDYEQIIKLSNRALKTFPINLRVMNFLAYTHHLKGDDAMARKISHNFHGLLNAVFSSGDGLECKTGFHVISVSHEYVLINMLQLEMISQSLDGKCDYLSFEKGKYKIDGMYFNISKLMEKGFGLTEL
ncbi:hypothetical protein ASG01_05425 [Chryseobacterium sp. Leaf180]|uniref:DUF4919 domain-containing protein n=1 Tax=Chryseobacterium sp. Leaf180 TaxID=1736289 RepID=UPI0006FF963B|nr:DUF4919 domain-containing protein [Chryseobacterium sp. Leaf180]KQR95705.1 hypothetical protein ASG01_05425 [Chryseobacterium sp. Leaf180]